jgi:NAD(P) transhydrogenase subunit alpha
MKVGVPKETEIGEKRVALIPETVSKLVKLGFEVLIETGSGTASYFPDRFYQESGASIISGRKTLLEQSEMILRVQKPSLEEVEFYPPKTVLIAFLQPLLNLDLVKKLNERKITAFSMDVIPRISRAQSMDALSSMSTAAGYKAVLLAAQELPKFFPLLMTAAGTMTPAKVFVIGAGVAGLQAIATARRLGAVVEAFDTRPAVKEQVESLGAKFAEIAWKLDEKQSQDAGGYAKELSEEHQKKEMELIAQKVKESDVVITTALIPGRKAPVLITEDMVKEMKLGSVIVDLASEMGGNCSLTKPGEVALMHDVKIIGLLNLPSLLSTHSSQMYSRNLFSFLNLLLKNGKIQLDWSDEIVSGACVVHDGEIKSETVKQRLIQAGSDGKVVSIKEGSETGTRGAVGGKGIS